MLAGTDRKREILSVSQRLFKEKGYTTTTVREIAKELNIEPASLYSHVNTKEDILDQICFGMAEKLLVAIDEVNDIYFDAERKLRMMVDNHVAILTDDLNAAAVFIKEWRHLSEPRLSEFVKLRKRYEQGLREIIQTGIDEHKFNEIDKKFGALTILSTVNGIIDWYKPDGNLTPKEIADSLYHFIWSGLRLDS
jgi:AcrR family transcriptional regulator